MVVTTAFVSSRHHQARWQRTRWTNTLVMTSSGSQSIGQNELGFVVNCFTNIGCTISALDKGRFASAAFTFVALGDPAPVKQHRRLALMAVTSIPKDPKVQRAKRARTNEEVTRPTDANNLRGSIRDV